MNNQKKENFLNSFINYNWFFKKFNSNKKNDFNLLYFYFMLNPDINLYGFFSLNSFFNMQERYFLEFLWFKNNSQYFNYDYINGKSDKSFSYYYYFYKKEFLYYKFIYNLFYTNHLKLLSLNLWNNILNENKNFKKNIIYDYFFFYKFININLINVSQYSKPFYNDLLNWLCAHDLLYGLDEEGFFYGEKNIDIININDFWFSFFIFILFYWIYIYSYSFFFFNFILILFFFWFWFYIFFKSMGGIKIIFTKNYFNYILNNNISNNFNEKYNYNFYYNTNSYSFFTKKIEFNEILIYIFKSFNNYYIYKSDYKGYLIDWIINFNLQIKLIKFYFFLYFFSIIYIGYYLYFYFIFPDGINTSFVEYSWYFFDIKWEHQYQLSIYILNFWLFLIFFSLFCFKVIQKKSNKNIKNYIYLIFLLNFFLFFNNIQIVRNFNLFEKLYNLNIIYCYDYFYGLNKYIFIIFFIFLFFLHTLFERENKEFSESDIHFLDFSDLNYNIYPNLTLNNKNILISYNNKLKYKNFYNNNDLKIYNGFLDNFESYLYGNYNFYYYKNYNDNNYKPKFISFSLINTFSLYNLKYFDYSSICETDESKFYKSQHHLYEDENVFWNYLDEDWTFFYDNYITDNFFYQLSLNNFKKRWYIDRFEFIDDDSLEYIADIKNNNYLLYNTNYINSLKFINKKWNNPDGGYYNSIYVS